MCFTISILRQGELMSAEEYYNRLPVVKASKTMIPELPYHYLISGFEHPKLAIVNQEGVSLYEWGLIPSWVKDEKSANDIRSKTLNAVGETAFEKASFQKSIISQRCLLPVSGFFEWRDVRGIKYPYFVQLNEQDYFSLGSLYDTWINRESGEIRNTFSIITTPANPLMEKIHNLKKRMPLILSPEDEMKWLDKDLSIQQIKKLINPFPENRMRVYSISREANNARNNRDIPGILKKVEYTELIKAE